MRPDILSDPVEILKSRHLDVVPYAKRVVALSEHLGIDLSSTLFALGYVPLCQQQDSHAAARRGLAKLIAERNEALRSAIPAMVRRHCGVLGLPGRVDVMPAVIEPLVSQALSVLAGISLDVAGVDYVSRIFSQTLGVAKRRKLEQTLGQMIAQLRAAFPDADDSGIGQRLALVILGRDAMLGTFGRSLHGMAQSAQGAAWSALDWPDAPHRTGVPYIDRVAIRDVCVGGQPVDAGGVIRAQLSEYEAAADPRKHLGFFGGGAHLCLGRALALEIWQGVAAYLSQSAARPLVLEYGLRRDDVFFLPQTFILEISAS